MPVWDGGWSLGQAGCPGPFPHVFVACPSFSALHHAALNGNTELITLLLEAQAAVDIKDNKGKACREPRSQGQVAEVGVPRDLGGPVTEVCPGSQAGSRQVLMGSTSWRSRVSSDRGKLPMALACPQACGHCTMRPGRVGRSP